MPQITIQPDTPLGIRTLVQFIHSHRVPRIVEISKNAKPFKTDRRDPNFDKPIANLTKIYS